MSSWTVDSGRLVRATVRPAPVGVLADAPAGSVFWDGRAATRLDLVSRCLPLRHRGNVNTSEASSGRRPGDEAALTEAEIDDVVAFLQPRRNGLKP